MWFVLMQITTDPVMGSPMLIIESDSLTEAGSDALRWLKSSHPGRKVAIYGVSAMFIHYTCDDILYSLIGPVDKLVLDK